jgi:hypothetical protein
MTIPLSPALLTAFSNLPGDLGRAALKRLPIWSCSVRGFACRSCYQKRGALLPHLFTLTRHHPRVTASGIFSVPLSVGFPRPGITRCTALWSSDFPLPRAFRPRTVTHSSGHPANCNTPLYGRLRSHRRSEARLAALAGNGGAGFAPAAAASRLQRSGIAAPTSFAPSGGTFRG